MPTRQELKELAQLRLKAADAEHADWNLMVSTAQYDHMTMQQALKHLIKILEQTLTRELLQRIIRITILKTNDPFVKEVNDTFKVKNSIKYLQSSVILYVYIERAIILESNALPSREKVSVIKTKHVYKNKHVDAIFNHG